MQRKNKLYILVQRINKGFGRIVRQNIQYALGRIKKISIAKQMKSLKSCIETSAIQQPMISSRRSTMYDTIRPLDNNYTSIQIINNSGFDKGAENNTLKMLDQLDNQFAYQKKDFIEKYINQTKKPILMIEDFPKSIFTTKNISQYNPHALKNIRQANYNEFFNEVLMKKTFFGKTVNRMEYKSTSIRSALTCVEQQYDQVAVSIFQKILKFESLACSRNKFSYAADLVNYCMKKSEQIIIQLYMQILKQLNGPKFRTYLQLLCVVCATIKVPFRMYTPLLNYFLTNLQKANTEFTYMFFLLIRNFDKPRKQGVTEFEAHCIMYMLQIPVTMDMPTQKTFFMQTTSSVEDLVECIVSFFELDATINYLIYFEENYYSTGKLFDCFFTSVLNVGNEIPLSTQQVYKKFHGYKVVLTFKNMMDSLKSKAGKDLLYIFQSKKYLQGAFSLTRDEMMLMAAYKYYSQNDALDVIDLCLYIPSIVIRAYGQRNVRKEIVKNFKAIKCTKNQARKNFLKLISDKDVFMALTFYSSLYFDDDDQITIDIVLFLRPGFITLFGYNDYPLYKSYQFEIIKEWGKTQSQICFKVSQTGSIHIECSNQALVNEVFEDYLKSLEEYVIDEKAVKEKQRQNQKNVKKKAIHKRSYQSDSTRGS